MNICNAQTMRKTIPIYKRIHPLKLMNLVKVFGSICNLKFNCQIFTKTHNNKWIFRYHAKEKISITLSFCDIHQESYPCIHIHEFIFSKQYQDVQSDDKILKTIIRHIKNLDFEFLIFHIKKSDHIKLCQQNGFKKRELDQMILSLKPKFIQISKPNNT
jgi:hypothetical protein